jgi:hypothetical protein
MSLSSIRIRRGHALDIQGEWNNGNQSSRLVQVLVLLAARLYLIVLR